MRDAFALLLMSPVLIPQAIWTGLRATQMPEAAGPRIGRSGTGARLRMLVTGDSSAAGVGAALQKDALAGQLAAQLDDFDVSWQVIAKSGGTTASTLELLGKAAPAPCDVAVIALGVNDTKNGVSASAWRRNYTQLIQTLLTDHGTPHVYVCGLPPVGKFPLLPMPLRWFLGRRAMQFDLILQHIANGKSGVTHVPMDLPFDATKMAPDGFHPSAEVYTAWAGLITNCIRRDQTTS